MSIHTNWVQFATRKQMLQDHQLCQLLLQPIMVRYHNQTLLHSGGCSYGQL